MRVVTIVPGACLPYYCESCAQDMSPWAVLSERGHSIVGSSLYLPREGRDGASTAEPVFYGALNLVLGHALPWYRGAPRWLRRALDGRPLLRLAASLSRSPDAAAMAPLTLSVLRGEEGASAFELQQLIRWLAEVQPDVLYLSTCLLLGIAGRAGRELGLPVACGLQDEDTWIDAMGPAERDSAWTILKGQVADVDRFLPVSAYYGRMMSERLCIPPEKIAVVQPGIDLDGFPADASPLELEPPSIGFLSRLSDSMGLSILVEAFVRLCRDSRFPHLRLRLAGGGTPEDFRRLGRLRRRLAERGLGERLDIERSFDRRDRIRFLRSIRVLSVPVPAGEAFGTFLLEAMAAGVPVVQPRLGGFTEVVTSTGGGVLYSPNTPEALAEALTAVLSDADKARALGASGFRGVRRMYTSLHVADRLERELEAIVEARKRAAS